MRLHRSIHDLPLARFIDVSVDGKLEALIIEGEASEEAMLDAWSRIQEQYAEAIGDHQQKAMVTLQREIHRLQCTIEQVQILLEVLEKRYVALFVKELNRVLNTTLVFDVTTPTIYDKNLSRVRSRLKGLKMQIDIKTRQLITMQERVQPGAVKADRSYYQDVLITLSDSAGYGLTDMITVYEFCERLKRLKRRAEQSK